MLKSVASAIIAALAATLPAHAQTIPVRPDPALTPGAIASRSVAEVCAPGYSRAHRVWHDKAGTLRKYGLPPSAMSAVEDDDRLPVCAGGANADPRNHWPELWADAHAKDRIEARICRMVCAGRITLDEAQKFFLGTGWER